MSSADASFMIFATALIFIMTPGLAFFYGGLLRKKNILNMMAMCFVSIAIVSIIWFLIGYSLAFAPDIFGGYIGGLDFTGLFNDWLTPNATYTIQLNYILKPAQLSSTNIQTYISQQFPNGLLYACLVEAFSFLKGPNDLLQLYEGKYKQVVEGFSIEQMGRRRRDEYQSGVPRIGK